MLTNKTSKKHKTQYILRQIAYLAFVLFTVITLSSKGYTDIGTIFACVMITIGTLIVAMYDWLIYTDYSNKGLKNKENE